MSKVFFIADLHLDHKNIVKFSGGLRGGSTLEEHNKWIVKQWNSVVGKRDTVFILGDVSFSKAGLKYLKQMRGQKRLIMGNHDNFNPEVYSPYFNKVGGIIKKYGMWLSHSPLHPSELRGLINIHGHIHNNGKVTLSETDPTLDTRYFNVNVDCLYGVPIELGEIIKRTGQEVVCSTPTRDS